MRALKAKGYVQLSETNDAAWAAIKPLGKYFFTRNQSTIVAFHVGGAWKPGNGFTIVGAHTDSPCLRVKPVSTLSSAGYSQVGVECYGGGLWNTWFDRDLSVAGRVVVKDGDKFATKLVCIDRPILRIPNLAIHLNRTIYTEGFKVNKETHTVPVLCTAVKEALMKAEDEDAGGATEPATKKVKTSSSTTTKAESSANERHHPILMALLADELGCTVGDIKDFELSLYDTQPSALCGAFNEFIAAPRQDNLMMSFCSLQALLAADDETAATEPTVRMAALFDHEEVGSQSATGAASHIMLSTLTRLSGAAHIDTAIQKSLMISADMAHAVHPNYAEKHEKQHRPEMHKGLVIKQNCNQRYATTGVTAFLLRELAEKHNIPVQDFVVRNDVGCGSTIGPALSSKLGIRVVDVGS
jgi:aspartyl aminopeptidase